MAVPPLNLNASSSSSAKGQSSAGFDNSGFVVNFGGGNSVGGLPTWVTYAAVIGAAILFLRRGKH